MRTNWKITFILIIIGILYFSIGVKPVEAATMSTPKYFGITELRTLSTPHLGYAIGDPGTNGVTGDAAKLWNIREYSSSTSNDPKEVNVYCVKAGVGFMDGVNKIAEYNLSFDMYKDKVSIAAQNNTLKGLIDGGHYDELLALANLLYLPGVDDEEDLRAYFTRAGIHEGEFDSELTLDEVKAVQQAAIWYFTNYGEENNKYDKTDDDVWLNYTEDGISYTSLSSYNPTNVPIGESYGTQRLEQANRLYNYLINTAKANSSIYANSESSNKNYKTKLTLYSSTGNNGEQPLMEIERVKEFDLSLRKYITKVNGTEVTASRVPQIDVTGLKNLTDTTASYKHKKDPVLVGIGDTVTYRIQVYNEGDIDGYVNKIVDQLPTGLTFSKLNTSGYTASYDSTSNKVTITRESSNDDKLTAYDGGSSLDSTTLELECKVTSTESNKVLTNVAWISEEETIDGKVITNEVGDDRDSEPTTAPNVNKDNMENYTGNGNKSDLTDSNYYYKGQQDDDDFEKLITKQITGSYNIQLEKVDKDNNSTKLSGAVFSVTLPGQSATNKTTGANGLVDLGTVNITDVNSTDTITIEETKAPDGYNKILDTMKLSVTKKIENGSYVANTVSITSGGVEGASATISGNTIKIVVPNKKITGSYKVQLEKVDKDNQSTKLEGAEFSITLPGASAITRTTDSNGLIDLGNVKITDISSTDTITVTETKAPDGYNKILGTMTLQVSKKVEDGSYVADKVSITSGQAEGTTATLDGNVIKIVVADEKKEGNYKLQLEKVDSKDNSKKLQGAEFSVTLPGKAAQTMTTNSSGLIDLGTVEITNVSSKDTITIEETKAPEGYNKILDAMTIEVEKQDLNGAYSLKNATITSGQVNGTSLTIDDNTIKITVADELITGNYGLQLEKVDSKDSSKKLQGAEFSVLLPGKQAATKTTDENGLIDLGTVEITNVGTKDTITIEETKAPNGYNKILDTMTIEVEKQLVNGEYKAKSATITSGAVTGTSVTLDGDIVKIVVANDKITGNYNLQLEKVDVEDNSKKLQGAEFSVTLPGKGAQNFVTDENGLIDLGTVEITGINENDTITIEETKAPENYDPILGTMTLEVSKIIRDGKYVAESVNITSGAVEGTTATLEGNTIKVVVSNRKIKQFDLALRKYISKVNDTEYDRAPQVDVINLANGTSTTATYNHPKTTVSVRPTDIVTYTIRVYNEGEADGYANEITDFLPPELEFLPDNEVNQEYEWQLGEDGRTVKTDYLSKAKETDERQNLIKAFDGQNLDYKEVQIVCKIRDGAEKNKRLTNLAEITEELNNDHEDVPDRDSTTDNVKLPSDEDLPGYKEDEIDKDYVPGQEDDDDFEKIIVQEFDLALRKFITKVDDKDITNRIPEVSYDEEENKITYNHTKEPVEVVTNNVVTYTIRIFNEGDINGYANEITDDIPEGLEFLPDNETNIEYRWVMYDANGEETEDVSQAVSIKTDYLSKEQEEKEGENLLHAFNPNEEISETNPEYRDVQVAFKVIEPNGSDRIIVNSAQISDDSDENGNEIDDKDSIPDEWNEGEDDQDKEYIKLVYFDLSLRKWVTQAIVIDKNGENITETGHQPYDDPEQIVKVDLNRKHINDVTVKFRYSIRVTNEGEIAGYAKEITDYVPEGLKFVAEDNPGWTDEGNNVISTRLLENTLLQPGEYADIEVVLTWINDANNMGLKVNTAEISEDYNDYGVPDKDSTPDNKKPGEDDIDDAPVMLSVGTGRAKVYFTLGFVILVTIAGGVFLIKKYVL